LAAESALPAFLYFRHGIRIRKQHQSQHCASFRPISFTYTDRNRLNERGVRANRLQVCRYGARLCCYPRVHQEVLRHGNPAGTMAWRWPHGDANGMKDRIGKDPSPACELATKWLTSVVPRKKAIICCPSATVPREVLPMNSIRLRRTDTMNHSSRYSLENQEGLPNSSDYFRPMSFTDTILCH